MRRVTYTVWWDPRWDWAGWHGMGWDGIHIHGLAWVLRLGSYEMHCWKGYKRWFHLWLWHCLCRFFCCGHGLVLCGWRWMGGLPWLLHFGLLSICVFAWSSAESSLHLGPTSVVVSVYRIHVHLLRISGFGGSSSVPGYRRTLNPPGSSSSQLVRACAVTPLAGAPPSCSSSGPLCREARGSSRDSHVFAFTFHLCVGLVRTAESSLHPICLQMPV